MVDIDTGVGVKRGAGPATRWFPRQPEPELTLDAFRRQIDLDPPTMPDLPVLPALPDLQELAKGSECNPLAERHVAVVGIHYAPEPTGVAPYTTAMAEHLSDRSRLVTVLTGLPHYPTWRVPAAYRGFGRNPELHTPTLHLVRHGHSVPRRQTPWSALRY